MGSRAFWDCRTEAKNVVEPVWAEDEVDMVERISGRVRGWWEEEEVGGGDRNFFSNSAVSSERLCGH